MQIQKSFHDETNKGILYLVPTPIGNLEDMTFRAIRILKEAHIIAAEDTRNTKKLCNYFEIETPILSYHEHNKETSSKQILSRLLSGEKVALVSDAGMPSISDPGYELVVASLEKEITVVPLPGANAALTALIASGINPQPFYFYGFLSRNKKVRRTELEILNQQTSTFILYEAPHRLKETLKAMSAVLGNRNIVLCRELTKKFEEFLRGTIEEVIEWYESNEVRGEFCIIVEGGSTPIEESESLWWETLNIVDHVEHYITQRSFTSKEAIKQVAKDRDIPKREVYQKYHREEVK
ncbi:16S rRNA (cytidine(1402)-2'-O)-methyltransferase [Heyndrickxia sporothermodurans]|uniref:Ribosomal RNA small subunit methyltransferase I n=1 Tax=Heyndrickxia sporothermodurans TaxID=46224 RepID=A0AB37HH07_9BACI|nr:16S rRNA (cytidine(1402)-2'-O)-methyltransferase [Heyndrickxia sporothermodurans]MBL5768896.1 16S rRNA (cytidine(1402)-2'-O)-methyltransferase [Heyndrickxia sporothermodurans]MBL5772659.1 16S rRNA (cytidine(1402)-2'-O)-methyltransferase [Heyndrickxia sporothermodurans]MBL5776154.1 16S rRNA (cytidine(1402)-2'-O)-methyltransferase [Heyndrickxia sporothermodurans]MBL5779692.1 16S rRNA (cytidine(1402)-2'-O)-methyltransferase [Heyndrickxia sporothermodurans]MBL5783241.1 16S rRNA (cytidine(1402)-